MLNPQYTKHGHRRRYTAFMRLALGFALVCGALFAQPRQLATTDDGSLLFFSSYSRRDCTCSPSRMRMISGGPAPAAVPELWLTPVLLCLAWPSPAAVSSVRAT